MRRGWRGAALVGLVALAAAGCGGRSRGAAERPNVLLITLDTVRADHLSMEGYDRPTAPILAGLARAGFRFERAYSPMPATGPAHSTLMTGRFPRDHGVLRNGVPLPASAETLAERLRDAGYRTAAVVSGYPLVARFGLDQGFSAYEDDFPAETASIPRGRWEGQAMAGAYDRRGDATAERALAQLRTLAEARRPFFLFVHFFDAHHPYAPPRPYADAFASERPDEVDDYDGEIAFADAQIGRLLDALRAAGALERTLVVVTSDHGEGLGDHGVARHGSVVYDEALRVPLLFSWPGRLAHGTSAAGVSLADVAPTVLELAGLEARAARGDDGLSLAPLLRGAGGFPARRLPLEAEHSLRRTQRAATDGRLKLVENPAGTSPRRALFDLAVDPHELSDVLAQRAADAARLEGALPPPPDRIPSVLHLEPEDTEALRALGYVN